MKITDRYDSTGRWIGRTFTDETPLSKSAAEDRAAIQKMNEQVEELDLFVKSLKAGHGSFQRALVRHGLLDEQSPVRYEPSPVRSKRSADQFVDQLTAGLASGRLTALDASRFEAYLNRGAAVPLDLIRRVLQG